MSQAAAMKRSPSMCLTDGVWCLAHMGCVHSVSRSPAQALRANCSLRGGGCGLGLSGRRRRPLAVIAAENPVDHTLCMRWPCVLWSRAQSRRRKGRCIPTELAALRSRQDRTDRTTGDRPQRRTSLPRARSRDLCGGLQSVPVTATLTIDVSAGVHLVRTCSSAATTQLCNVILKPWRMLGSERSTLMFEGQVGGTVHSVSKLAAAVASSGSAMFVIKRDGRKEPVHFDKITARITKLSYGLNPDFCDPVSPFVTAPSGQVSFSSGTAMTSDTLVLRTFAGVRKPRNCVHAQHFKWTLASRRRLVLRAGVGRPEGYHGRLQGRHDV